MCHTQLTGNKCHVPNTVGRQYVPCAIHSWQANSTEGSLLINFQEIFHFIFLICNCGCALLPYINNAARYITPATVGKIHHTCHNLQDTPCLPQSARYTTPATIAKLDTSHLPQSVRHHTCHNRQDTSHLPQSVRYITPATIGKIRHTFHNRQDTPHLPQSAS